MCFFVTYFQDSEKFRNFAQNLITLCAFNFPNLENRCKGSELFSYMQIKFEKNVNNMLFLAK